MLVWAVEDDGVGVLMVGDSSGTGGELLFVDHICSLYIEDEEGMLFREYCDVGRGECDYEFDFALL